MEITLELKKACIIRKGKEVCRAVPLNLANNRLHWTIKRQWRLAWLYEIIYSLLPKRKEFGKLPVKKPSIRFELYTTRPMDRDGAYHSIKPLLDLLTERHKDGLGIIKDDSPKELENLEVETIKVKHRTEEKTKIIITFCKQ